MKLYELTEAYQSILDNEEMSPDTISDTLESIHDAIEIKAQSCVAIFKTLKAERDAYKKEKETFAAKEKAAQAKIDWLESYWKFCLENIGKDSFKTTLGTIRIQNNPPSVNITDESKIPSSYLTIVPEQHIPDKKRILEDLKAGKNIPGAELHQGNHLRVG